MGVRRKRVFNAGIGFEELDVRVSPTFVAVSGITAASVVSTVTQCTAVDDPQPIPEPPLPPYPGDNPPIDPP
jgi:hypothetical protein